MMILLCRCWAFQTITSRMQCNEVTVHCFVVLTFANLQWKQWVGITCFRRTIISFTYSYGSHETQKNAYFYIKIYNFESAWYGKANKNINLNILNVYFLIFQTSNLNLLAYYAKQDLAKHSTKGTNKSIILR